MGANSIAKGILKSLNFPSVPKFAQEPEDLAALGLRLTQAVNQGTVAKGDAPTIWMNIERFWRNDPPTQDTAPGPGLAPIHQPFLQPRIDAVAASVTGTVLSPDPVLLCRSSIGDETASKIERLVQNQLRMGGFDAAVRQAATLAALTNHGILRVTFEHIPHGLLSEDSADVVPDVLGSSQKSSLKVDCIHPNNFFGAPATIDGIPSMTYCGHRFYQRTERIEYMRELGYYLPGPEVPPSSPTARDTQLEVTAARTSPDSTQSMKETEVVECYEIFMRGPSDESEHIETWYRIEFAYPTSQVLKIEHWPYSRPPYFNLQLLTDVLTFWGPRSIGRNLIPLQDQYNKLWSLEYNGTMMSAMPPIVGPRLRDSKFKRYGPGDYIEADPGTAQPFAPTILRPDNIRNAIEALERNGDQVARISTPMLGSEEGKSAITATQSNFIQQGASLGIEEYISCFALEFPLLGQFALELLYDNYALWAGFPTETENMVSKEELTTAYGWELNGRNPNATPMAKAAIMAKTIEMAAQIPALGFDIYKAGTIWLTQSGVSGSDGIQVQRESLQQQQLPGGPTSPASGSGGGPTNVGSPSGGALTPQETPQGGLLPPIPESTSRGKGIGAMPGGSAISGSSA